MNPPLWIPRPCGVCGQRKVASSVSAVDPQWINLELLQNPALPERTWPQTYNFTAYKRAILHSKALRNPDELDCIDICTPCKRSLDKGEQPLDALANFQYYARDRLPVAVRQSIQDASMFDLMMICHSRATRVTHLFSKNRSSPMYGTDASVSQRFNHGNVAILPQDVATLRPLLPPSRSEIEEAMCAMFVGSNVVPSRENILRLSPVLVSKNRVATLLDFLLQENPYYRESTTFSQENFDDLLRPEDDTEGVGIPRAVELCCLPHTEALDTSTSGYVPKPDAQPNPPDPEVDNEANLIMEAIGYTAGDRTPQDYHAMKASALAWCLDKKKFIKMQSGSKYITERDAGMLTYTFPHLDPWGIGGFNEPMR
ncbi:hypothetical protein C8R43DRAFT_895803, partial [Mycena crocata]